MVIYGEYTDPHQATGGHLIKSGLREYDPKTTLNQHKWHLTNCVVSDAVPFIQLPLTVMHINATAFGPTIDDVKKANINIMEFPFCKPKL